MMVALTAAMVTVAAARAASAAASAAATVEGLAAAATAAAARVGAAKAATAVASIFRLSHCSPSLTRNIWYLVGCQGLRRRTFCLGRRCMYLRASIRVIPVAKAEEEEATARAEKAERAERAERSVVAVAARAVAAVAARAAAKEAAGWVEATAVAVKEGLRVEEVMAAAMMVAAARAAAARAAAARATLWAAAARAAVVMVDPETVHGQHLPMSAAGSATLQISPRRLHLFSLEKQRVAKNSCHSAHPIQAAQHHAALATGRAPCSLRAQSTVCLG